eukprot:jgi/Mesvir1/20639/Mv14861-RA.1
MDPSTPADAGAAVPGGGQIQGSETAAASLEKLQAAEKKLVDIVTLAARVMDELAGDEDTGEVDRDAVLANSKAYIVTLQELHSTLREGIQAMPETAPFENSSYVARMRADVAFRKLELVGRHVVAAQEIAKEYDDLSRTQ